MKNITYIISCAFFLMLCISCHSDEGDDAIHETKDKSISFSLQLGNEYVSNSRTRVGTDYETKVDENNINVLIYDGTTYVGKVENIKLNRIADNLGVYIFKGNVSKGLLLPDKEYRFMVVANCNIPADNNKQENTVFESSKIGEWIPMWGVTTYKVTDKDEQQLKSISLIRAVAKIKVELNKQLLNSGYKIHKVSVNYMADKGNAFPKNWKNLAESTSATDYFNPIASIVNNKDFKVFAKGSKAILYVPEYDNTSVTANAAKLTVVLTDKDNNKLTFMDCVEFKNYVNGKPVDGTLSNIERNVSYEYKINSIGHELSLTAAVQPWDCIEETWDYTDQITIREEGKLKWDDGTYATIDKATSTVVLKPSVNLTGKFTIDSPVGSKWFATFIPVSGMNNSFVFKINGQSSGTASGNVGDNVTLNIEPVHDEIIKNNVAKLRIIVITPDGRTLNVNELLPYGFVEDEYTIIQTK